MNPNDVQIELKPIKKELVAFEQRVINLENKFSVLDKQVESTVSLCGDHATLIASLSARLKILEDVRKIQISLNTQFLKFLDNSSEIKVVEKKKSFWEKIRG